MFNHKIVHNNKFKFSSKQLVKIHKAIFDEKYNSKIEKNKIVALDDLFYGHECKLQRIEGIAEFVYKIYKLEPFKTGNARSLAIFSIKLLRYAGFTPNVWRFQNEFLFFVNVLQKDSSSALEYFFKMTKSKKSDYAQNLLLGAKCILTSVRGRSRVKNLATAYYNKHREYLALSDKSSLIVKKIEPIIESYKSKTIEDSEIIEKLINAYEDIFDEKIELYTTTYFGLRVIEENSRGFGVYEDDIKQLPFYEFWKESATGSAQVIEKDTNKLIIFLSDWIAFCDIFIKSGKHRYM